MNISSCAENEKRRAVVRLDDAIHALSIANVALYRVYIYSGGDEKMDEHTASLDAAVELVRNIRDALAPQEEV